VWEFAGQFAPSGNFGIPSYTILNRELEIESFAGQRNDSLIDSLLAAPVPSVDWPMP
jgi:hypothetical protein